MSSRRCSDDHYDVTAPLLLFPDTTVLINFHICSAMPLLDTLTRKRGQWTATIRQECIRKEDDLELPQLAAAAEGVFGDPLYPDEDEHRAIRDLRALMARPGDHRDQHLGEAETVVILERRALNAIFITDDSHVQEFTHKTCITSWDLLGHGLQLGDVTEGQIRSMRGMLLAQRRVHINEVKDAASFEMWLASRKP